MRLFGICVGAVACLAGYGTQAQETTNFIYDAKGRLVATSRSGGASSGVSTSYTYDKADNRSNVTVTDASKTLSIGNASVTEGENLVFTVTRAGNLAGTVGVSWATSAGTATSGSDFTAGSGMLSFAAGETSKTISVTTIDDTVVESAETMKVTLSSPTGGATITNALGTGTINDNDVAPAILAIGNASATEGGNLVFTVTRSGNTGIAASASWATSAGTATSGSDFTAGSGSLSFTAGQTSKTISVATIDDAAVESSETMKVTLSSPSANTTIATAIGTGTIADNDVMTPVYRFYQNPRHWLTISYSEGINAGWTFETIAFYLFPTGGAGYHALYRCYNPTGQHRFVSTQSNCEGFVSQGLMGYARSTSATGFVALHRFFKAAINDHLITVNYNEGSQNAYSYEGVLGYVQP